MADRIESIVWMYQGITFESRVLCNCPKCNKFAIVELPLAILRQQPDETTHVCLPAVGGCNHGFAVKPSEVA